MSEVTEQKYRKDSEHTRNSTADRHKAITLNNRQRLIQHIPTDIIKETVRLALQRFLELSTKILVLVVDTCVGSERLDVLALFVATGDTDDALAPDDVFGDLDQGGSYGTRCARDEKSVFGFEVHFAECADPGCSACEAEAADRDPGRLTLDIAAISATFFRASGFLTIPGDTSFLRHACWVKWPRLTRRAPGCHLLP